MVVIIYFLKIIFVSSFCSNILIVEATFEYCVTYTEKVICVLQILLDLWTIFITSYQIFSSRSLKHKVFIKFVDINDYIPR